MSIALARVSLLIIATTLQTLGVAPPNPIADEAHQENFHKSSGLSAPANNNDGTRRTGKVTHLDESTKPRNRKTTVRWGTVYLPYTSLVFFWILAILEIRQSFSHEDPLNFQFVSGILVTALASILRIASFRSLGDHFTYQLAILPSHKLVTSGPYAYVRHPSYVALLLISLGCALSFTSSGTALCGWVGASNADTLMLGVLTPNIYVSWVFLKRAEAEDRVLREEFGKEWEEWARVVKYKFIPGFY